MAKPLLLQGRIHNRCIFAERMVRIVTVPDRLMAMHPNLCLSGNSSFHFHTCVHLHAERKDGAILRLQRVRVDVPCRSRCPLVPLGLEAGSDLLLGLSVFVL